MLSIISPVVGLLGQLIPVVGTNSALITSIIDTLIEVVPVVVSTAKDLIPPVKNIIAALSENPATTAEQLATLKELDAQADDAFEAAAIDPDADAEASK